jgi:hypothetical protein
VSHAPGLLAYVARRLDPPSAPRSHSAAVRRQCPWKRSLGLVEVLGFWQSKHKVVFEKPER